MGGRLGRLPNRYDRIDKKGEVHRDAYRLMCSVQGFWGEGWDIFGWIVSYNGPRDAQRLNVELF